MSKIKLFIGFAALMTSLVISAAPASAWFESESASTTGKIKTFPESTAFKTTPTGPAIECKNASGEAAGTWEIKTAAEVAAKAGPHEQLTITKWGKCTGPTLLPARVKCNLLVVQNTKSTIEKQIGSGGPATTGCVVEVGNEGGNNCIVTVSNASNKELKEVKLVNLIPKEVSLSSEVKGVTSTLTEKGEECKVLKIAAGKEGEFKNKNPLITEGQKLV